SHHVDYLIVGAFALAFHGVPRYTGDIDILVRATPENAAHVDQVLKEFSFVSGTCSRGFSSTGAGRPAWLSTESTCSLQLQEFSSKTHGRNVCRESFRG